MVQGKGVPEGKKYTDGFMPYYRGSVLAMVSLRKRKHNIGSSNGRCSSSLDSPPSFKDQIDPESLDKRRKLVSSQPVPSVALNLPIGVMEQRKMMADPMTKKHKIHCQIDPYSSIQVYSYLMQLKKEDKLKLPPAKKSEEMPVKEWMEKLYPDIFNVFPQEPNLSQVSEKWIHEFLFSQYWAFVCVLWQLVSLDHCISLANVESLGKLIKSLEEDGFDCRFIRSALLVVGSQVKQQLAMISTERNVIATKTATLEKEMESAAEKKDMEKRVELIEGIDQDTHKTLLLIHDPKFIEILVLIHKKMLAEKEEDEKRLDLVLKKLNQLHHGKSISLGC
ncbi:uncharacterized protein LOC120007038 isoform X1 [Tripterygium wilfordii]|uniref:uncharacterized protein LOC120007038 isoform X1 n=1 Tax=Tripterygium wilfordii TaxID=458696 RepID=UPI0018F82276|nr:uncharacterized protein LOC120007038 isoform X1 [Tripterygium wilfordii]